MPRPRLWVLLNAPAALLQERKQEVAPEETARQCEAYLHFIRTRNKYVIVDAAQPLDRVVADVERAVDRELKEGKANRG